MHVSGLSPTADAPPEDSPSIPRWLIDGWRVAFLRAPRLAGRSLRPTQLLVLVTLTVAIELGLGRFEVNGPAAFSTRAWLAPWWAVGASTFLFWILLSLRPRAGWSGPRVALGTWLALWFAASIPINIAWEALAIAQAHGALPLALVRSTAFAWVMYVGAVAWAVAVAACLGWRFGLRPAALVALGACLFSLYFVSGWQFPERPWQPAELHDDRPVLELTQEVFEAQQGAWTQALAALAPRREAGPNVYALVFAPYASEDVFLRESNLVAEVLRSRFDADGRVLQLVNHPATAARLPWATPLNLKRGIDALASRMDRQQDVLLVYLTSHGANDFQLAAEHWPLTVAPVSPGDLRRMLDEAGIVNRIIMVSACYSGGWVGPLATGSTLVMTAAAADQTSYGCGSRSELTFFGRALFAEQLRRTRSFEDAFAAAVPVIRKREQEAGKPDGFSNPQISVGERIRPVLGALQERLDGAAAADRALPGRPDEPGR